MGEVDERLLAYWLSCRTGGADETEDERPWEQAVSAAAGGSAAVVRFPLDDR